MGRRFARRAAALAALPALAACSGSRARAATTQTSRVATATTNAEPAAPGPPATPSGTRVVWLPRPTVLDRIDPPWTVIAAEGPGGADLLAGSIRVHVGPGEASVGRDVLGTRSIIDVAPVGARRVLITQDGVIASASTWTAPVHPLGAVRLFHDALAFAGGGGRFVCATRDGFVTSDGVAPLAPLRVPGGAVRVTSVAFATPSFAAATAFPSRLQSTTVDDELFFVTRNGGATWAPLHSLSDPGLGGPPSPFTRDPNWNVRVTSLPLPMEFNTHSLPSDDKSHAADNAVVDAFPEYAFTTAGAVASDGFAWVQLGGGLHEVDVATGHVLHGPPSHLDCRLYPWGSAVALACEGAYVARSERGAPWHNLEVTDLRAFCDDGVHGARVRSCDGASWAGLCGWSGRALVPIPLPFDSYELRDRCHGDAVLLLAYPARDQPDRDLELDVVSIDSGRVRAVAFSPPPTGHVVHLVDGVITPGGMLVAHGEERTGRNRGPRWFALGAVGETLAWRTLPAGAFAVGFIDATHGVAAGATAADLWQTDDGGATFRPLHLPQPADPHAWKLGEIFTPPTELMHCSPGACVVASQLVIRGYGPLQDSTQQVLTGVSQEE